jgi:hypothetical protein
MSILVLKLDLFNTASLIIVGLIRASSTAVPRWLVIILPHLEACSDPL